MSLLGILPWATLFFTGFGSVQGQDYLAYMIVGGKARKDVEFHRMPGIGPGDVGQTLGDCDSFAEAPFVTQHAIGLRDSVGKPMICGGSKNPDPKSCYVYDITNNTWSQGPSLKRKRVGASATCLPDGVCWVFGGKSKSYTEFYNPTTGQFEMGPEMPVNSAHGLCSARSYFTGLIYIAARREPGITRLFTFDPATITFTELPSLNEDKRYMSCGIIDASWSTSFYLIGGGESENAPTSSVHLYESRDNAWVQKADFLYPVFGGTVMAGPEDFFFRVYGGITSATGDETDGITECHLEFGGCSFSIDISDLSPRSYGVSVLVDNVCPGAPTAV